MTEVEIIQKIAMKQSELQKKQAENADAAVITAIQKEIAELTDSLPSVEQSRGKQAFLDECAG